MVHRGMGGKKDLEGSHHLYCTSLSSWTMASGSVTSHHVLPRAAHNGLDVWD